jgi:AraC-like DNA-binding protein
MNISGHARLTCDGRSALLGPMTAVLYHVSGHEPVAWRLPGERHQFLTLEYSRTYLERHLSGRELALHPVLRTALLRQKNALRLAGVIRLTVGMKKAIEVFRNPPVAQPGINLWYQAKALETAAEFFFDSDGGVSGTQLRQAEVARHRVERVIEILAQRMAEPPTLEELGREVGCSQYHLSRTFSREMGMSIPQYLRQVRMEKAAELLKSGKYNVTEAALEVGYSSVSHFSKAFCETIGCCPGLYPFGKLRPEVSGPATSANNRQKSATHR